MNLIQPFRPAHASVEAAKDQQVAPIAKGGETLEDVLMDLARWGRPRVGQYGSDNIWHCSIEANVNATGLKFEARSDFKQLSPLAAALQCRENLRNAVKAIGGAA